MMGDVYTYTYMHTMVYHMMGEGLWRMMGEGNTHLGCAAKHSTTTGGHSADSARCALTGMPQFGCQCAGINEVGDLGRARSGRAGICIKPSTPLWRGALALPLGARRAFMVP